MKIRMPAALIAVVYALFCIFLCISGCHSGGSAKQGDDEDTGKKVLYERDLKKLVREGNFVAVDKDEKDVFIQEDIYSTDYGIIADLTMIKSEAMGVPLYTEDIGTFGDKVYIEEFNPTDRKAHQDFLITETQLLDPSYYSGQKYLEENVNRAEAMDKERTVPEMLDFIDRYPDSKMASRAISYIEYQLCAVKKDPLEAIKLYKEIKKKYPDKKQLNEILDEYIKRANEYLEKYEAERRGMK
ncbi:MAG: hypothetical protein LWY06_08905 [Firmicutes bacterium]|nr:hypothetical protein [Bacillota bacterium]